MGANNQKNILISKITETHCFAKIDLKALELAARNLDAGAFKLWIYFCKNKHEYKFALSSKEVEENFGIKKKQYDKAIKELIEKKYLVHIDDNNYILYDLPQL